MSSQLLEIKALTGQVPRWVIYTDTKIAYNEREVRLDAKASSNEWK